MNNILSIDLESWVHFYCVLFGKNSIRDRKRADNNHIVYATTRILDLLDKYRQKSTFFVLGEIFDWYPGLIRKIKQRGHEIGYHGHNHSNMTDRKFLAQQVRKSSKFIRKFKPKGFRPPNMRITEDLIACLKKWGFTYSSSTYGKFETRRAIDGIKEFPVPLFGGGYSISLLGTRIISNLINRLNRRGIPIIIFFHPWQLYYTPEIGSTSFKIKVLLRKPIYFPYTKNILTTVIKLMKRFRFKSFKDEMKRYPL